MLNIKTLIQSIYSYMVSNVRKSIKAFIALSAIIVAGVLVICIGAGGKTLSSDDEDAADEYVLELEDEIITDENGSHCETDKEYCLETDKVEISDITQEAPGRFLAGNTFEIITYGGFLNEELDVTEDVTEETVFEEGKTDETEGTADDNKTENNTGYEMSDRETAEMLVPGDLFEGSDGTILVANQLGLRITAEDYECLLRIIQAEAGNQGLKGKILVGNVIINRVRSHRYANDIQGVVFQKGQFSPTNKGGTYYKVKVNSETEKAVYEILSGTDYSKGAEYFCGKTSPNSMFNTRLKFLFKYKSHYFYKK